VSSLVDKDGFLHSNSKQKAEILNDQFHSVYTAEDHNNFPDRGRSQYSTMDKIKVQWCTETTQELEGTQSYRTR